MKEQNALTNLTEFVGYDVELTSEEYEMIDFAILAFYEKMNQISPL